MIDWDNVARTAQTPWEAGLWSRESCQARMDRAWEKLEAYPGASVLDWGCGVGYFSEWVPDHINYHGVDSSHSMIDRARGEHPSRPFTHTDNFIWEPGVYTHIAALGLWNLRQDWSINQTWEAMTRLWNLRPDRMVVSLYAGHDPHDRHIQYTPAETAYVANYLSPSKWEVAKWRANDIMLVLG